MVENSEVEASSFLEEEHGRLVRISSVEEYLNSLPTGYKFDPTDEELIVHYLMKKVSNLPLPINRFKSINIYLYNPQQLSEMYELHGDKAWYFFTPRSRKYPNGNRPNRAANGGYWKATGADHTIMNCEGRPVGYRKALVFYEGKARHGGVKTIWIMHEFRIYQKKTTAPTRIRDANNMKLDDWVLCKIYKKVESKKDNQQHENEETTAMNPDQEAVPVTTFASQSNVGSPLSTNKTAPSGLLEIYWSATRSFTALKDTVAGDYMCDGSVQNDFTNQVVARNSIMEDMYPLEAPKDEFPKHEQENDDLFASLERIEALDYAFLL